MRQARNPRPAANRPSGLQGKAPAERLTAFLNACGGSVRQTGEEHMFRCPCREAHTNGDEHPSASVRVEDDGKLLLFCHTGCSSEDIVAAIGWSMADLMPPATVPTRGRSKGKAKKLYANLDDAAAAAARMHRGTYESTHTYRNADDQPVLAVIRVRLPDGSKEVPQLRPERGGWVFGGIGKDRDTRRAVRAVRPLYNLPALLASSPDVPIAIVEGEGKADLLAKLGFLATTTSQGAGKAKFSDFAVLAGRRVLLFADKDVPGVGHMRDVAACALAAGARQVFDVHLPDLPSKGDVVDFYKARTGAGLSDEQIADEIRDAISRALEVRPEPAEKAEEPDTDEPPVVSDKIADQLVAMAADADLFHDEHGEAFASFVVDGHRETWRISSRQFSLWLSSRFYRAHKVAVPPQAMTTAINTLTAMASFDGPCQPVYMRVARIDNTVWLDLANEKWQAVRISPAGWSLVDEPPVRFVRRTGMKALPVPVAGWDNLDPLFDLLHVDGRDQRILITTWLTNATIPSPSYPILCVAGEQGSGKSTICRAQQRLLDPHKIEGRSPPRNEEDLAIGSQQAHVLIYENLSSLSGALSDAMCRASTGAGFGGRKLYTDDEERQLTFCRPLIVNGIGDLATKSDFADRAVTINLQPIPRERRQTEGSLWHAFDAMHPQLLGALLTIVSKVLATPDLEVPLERMAEFSLLGAKVAVALGLPTTAFTDAYRENRDGSSLAALESSSIGPVLLRLVRTEPVRFPIGALLFKLQHAADKYEIRHPEWPRTPRALGNELRRLAPNLDRLGFRVIFLPRRNDGVWVAIEATRAADVHDVHDVHSDDGNT